MSEIKQFMTNLFKKYEIYNRKQFLAVSIYIIRAILDGTIAYENDYQYCVGFYLLYFQSVPYDSVPTNILLKLIESQRDTNVVLDASLPAAPANSFGVLADSLFPILANRSVSVSDLEEGFDVQLLSNNTIQLNGITSTTMRGCVWKLLYASLKYALEN